MKFPARAPRRTLCRPAGARREERPRAATAHAPVDYSESSHLGLRTESAKPYGDGPVRHGRLPPLPWTERGLGGAESTASSSGRRRGECAQGSNEYFDAFGQSRAPWTTRPDSRAAGLNSLNKPKASANNFVSNVAKQRACHPTTCQAPGALPRHHTPSCSCTPTAPHMAAGRPIWMHSAPTQQPAENRSLLSRPFIYAVDKGEPRLYSYPRTAQTTAGSSPGCRPAALEDRGDFVFWPPAD